MSVDYFRKKYTVRGLVVPMKEAGFGPRICGIIYLTTSNKAVVGNAISECGE